MKRHRRDPFPTHVCGHRPVASGVPALGWVWRSVASARVVLVLQVLFLLACGAMFSGCEDGDILGGIYEVAFGEDMQITTTNNPVGGVGIPFAWPIYAEVKNDPFDDLYDYNWRLTGGELPEGLSFSDVGDHALVSGTATQAGVFEVEVYVDSDRLRNKSYAEDSDVWSTSDRETFTVTILDE